MKSISTKNQSNLKNLAVFLDLLIQIDLSVPKKPVQIKAKPIK